MASNAVGASPAAGDPVSDARGLLSVPDARVLRHESNPKSCDLGEYSRLVPFFQAAWALNQAAYPELAWGKSSAPEVRIVFGQFRARHLRWTSGDDAEIASTRRYAEQYLGDPIDAIRSAAAGYRAALGSPADVPRLIDIHLLVRYHTIPQ